VALPNIARPRFEAVGQKTTAEEERSELKGGFTKLCNPKQFTRIKQPEITKSQALTSNSPGYLIRLPGLGVIFLMPLRGTIIPDAGCCNRETLHRRFA